MVSRGDAGVVPGPKPPPWLVAMFPSSFDDAAPLRWGFTNESWRVWLADGRQLAVTRLAQARAAGVVPARVAAMGPRLEAVGLPAVLAAERSPAWPSDVLVAAFVDGQPGSELLGEPTGARTIGRLSGVVWRHLSLVDPSGLGLPTLWAEPDALTAAAAEWAALAGTGLTGAERAFVEQAIATLPRLLDARPASLVHGDLVPVNILVRDGELAAILDLESTRVGDPLIDVAWFSHIVRYHHPSDHSAAWDAFLGGAGIDPDDARVRQRHVLPIVLILERMAEGDGAGSDRWLDQLQFAIRVGRAAESASTAGP